MYLPAYTIRIHAGDGSLIYELLSMKATPKMVTMIDLDEAVLSGCSQHMTKACGKFLQQRQGSNFEIKVGDAVDFMRQRITEGTKYDYVFTDLTDMPVGLADEAEGSAASDLWKFLCLVAKLAAQLVVPQTGKLMAHCNRKTLPDFISKFESMLTSLKVEKLPELKPILERRDSFVPSFMGTWVFFYVQFCK